MLKIDKRIQKYLKVIKRDFRKKFKDNICAIILYGSWIKGRASKDSDIDLLIIFKRKNLTKQTHRLVENLDSERHISLISTSLTEFKKETLPLYTAVKKESRIIYGKVDLTLNPQPPQIKYKDFFKKSENFERQKIETAEYLIKKGISSGVSEFCYVASKHTVQVGLAMKGIGFSSKFCVLVKWMEEYLGRELTRAFKTLFALYVKSEYKMQDLSKQENLLSIREAKRILNHIFSTRDFVSLHKFNQND